MRRSRTYFARRTNSTRKYLEVSTNTPSQCPTTDASCTVKEALRRGKRFHIVHHDWFEFSAVAGKKLPERDYSMRKLQAKKQAEKRALAKIERGKREGEKAVNTSEFYPFRDLFRR